MITFTLLGQWLSLLREEADKLRVDNRDEIVFIEKNAKLLLEKA